MDKNTIIAVHGAHDPSGGVYNVLGSFSQGLLKGFKQNGIVAHSTVDCINNNIPFNITFGFNTSGLQVEKQLLKQGIPHVMWTVDSTFAHNFNSIYEFSNEPLFFLLEITSSDNDATSKFMPNLKHTFLPHATDLDVWKKQDIEKDYDIVFLSSIVDYEKKLQEIKERTNDKYFSLVMQMIEIGLKNQTLPFFEIYKIFQKHEGFEFNAP